MNKYIKDLGIHVGNFNEKEIKNGVDKKILNEYKEKYSEYKYTNTKIIKEKGIKKLAIYICSVEDFKI